MSGNPKTYTAEQLKGLMREIVGETLKEFEERQKATQAKVDEELAAARKAMLERAADPGAKADDEQKTADIGQYFRAMALGKGDPQRALQVAKDRGWKRTAEHFEKAQQSSSLASGGALVADEVSTEVIGLLGAKTVVRQAGATVLPLPTGALSMPYADTGPTAYYEGEGDQPTTSAAIFGRLKLAAKKLIMVVPISNDLLKDTSGRADRIIRDLMVQQGARRADLAFLRGDGTQDTPKGVRQWILEEASDHAFNTAGTDAASTTSDLVKLVRVCDEDDAPTEDGAYFMAPRSFWYLMAQRDGNNNLIWADEMRRGTLFGYKVLRTSQIPVNLGGGSNQSEIIFANASGIYIGESDMIEIEVFPGGSYYNGSATVSGITKDETVLRLIGRHDLAMQYRAKEASICQQVAYGA